MNKCAERLYNGLVKENPTFVHARYVSDSCSYNICDQRNRYGAFYDSGTCDVKYVDFYVEKVIPASVRMPAFYRCCSFFVTIVDYDGGICSRAL